MTDPFDFPCVFIVISGCSASGQYSHSPEFQVKHNVSHSLQFLCQISGMRKSLDGQLANYLKNARGGMSYAQFSKVTGISHSMLHRLELRERHITLNKLETVMNKLKIKLVDIFPEEF